MLLLEQGQVSAGTREMHLPCLYPNEGMCGQYEEAGVVPCEVKGIAG